MMDVVLPRGTLEDAAENAGLDPDAIRDDYSGRGMYGATCLGVVADTPGQALLFAAHLAYGFDVDEFAWLGDVRTDSMGLGTIYYWPGLRVEEERN